VVSATPVAEAVDRDAIDLADPKLHASERVHEIFRYLRDHEPLFWNRERLEPGFWSVTRYEDCVRVLKDAASFSSGQTNVLGVHRVFGDKGSGKMLNATDPPRHGDLRRLVNRCFGPRAVAELEPYLRQVVADALEPAFEQERVDLVDVVALLPVAGISALLGVPREDWSMLLRLTSMAFGSFDAEFQLTPDVRANMAQAHGRLLIYCRSLIEARRSGGGDDIVATLARAEQDGVLSQEESALFFDLLLLGGNETTRHGAVGGVLAFVEFPDQWARLKEDRSLLGGAVDEVLRWTSPSRHVLRRATRDVELHSRVIRAGDDVVVWHASSNRDERAFPEPDRFDVGRTPNAHAAFGSGPHYCLGAPLANLELRVFLDELAERVEEIELLAPPERLQSAVISGIKHLPARLGRA
jgi:cytochrome P450